MNIFKRMVLWPSGRRLSDLPCPVCGAQDRNCQGRVTSACGGPAVSLAEALGRTGVSSDENRP